MSFNDFRIICLIIKLFWKNYIPQKKKQKEINENDKNSKIEHY